MTDYGGKRYVYYRLEMGNWQCVDPRGVSDQMSPRINTLMTMVNIDK